MSLFETHLDTDSRTVYLPELKICGHNCCPSSVPKCCACSDLRPVLETSSYPCYVDGEGWKNTETRDAGYCPVCNPKNYEVWERRIAEERAKRWEQKRVQALRGEEAAVMREEDRKRAADLAVPAAITATTTTTTTTATTTTTTTTTTFTYSNGDNYEGDMNTAGSPHGTGVMRYATGEEYVGVWRDGKHHGRGDKCWGDGITYSGEWEDDMMHGKGHYVMADGTEVVGSFAYDEFVE